MAIIVAERAITWEIRFQAAGNQRRSPRFRLDCPRLASQPCHAHASHTHRRSRILSGSFEVPGGRCMKKVSVNNFRSDPMFPRIERAVADQLADWRQGRIAYLERVITCNLLRVSRILRIISFYAHYLDLKPSFTVYNRHGKGPRQRLRFSKTGNPNLESAYATHFVRRGTRPETVDDRLHADE